MAFFVFDAAAPSVITKVRNPTPDTSCISGSGDIVVINMISFKLIIIIMTIIENNFRKIDLNLLIAFDVLMREKSVTRAAEQLALGQPAMSGALSRLREAFQDELFVRTAHGMEPTTKALSLATQLAPALEIIQTTLFEQMHFEPTTDSYTFNIGMRDWVEVWLMPMLIARVQRVAPNVRIAVKATDQYEVTQMLEEEEMDLGIAIISKGPSWLRQVQLTTMNYNCVYDGKYLGLGTHLTLDQYLAYPHLLTSPHGDFRGLVDDELVKLKRRRRVIYTTPHFGALPFLMQGADVIATVPEKSAQRWAESFQLTCSPVPLPLAPLELSMAWHARRDNDPALQWLRCIMREIIAGETYAR